MNPRRKKLKMSGYIGKIYLDKRLIESNLLLEQDERYDDYYAMKVNDELYHIYGVKGPRLITRLDNYDLARFTEKE